MSSRLSAAVLAAILLAVDLAVAAQPSMVPPLPAAIDPLVRNMDPAAKPGDDFFQYANGTWVRNNPIPASERYWGIGKVLQREIYGQLRGICEEAARSQAPIGSNQRKLGDFWSSGMDSTAIEAQGLTPIRSELDRIEAIESRGGLLETIATLRVEGVGSLYSLYVGQDDKNSAQYVVFLHQGGLGLPDRDYYFADDAQTTKVREEYPRHIAEMFHLLGDDGAEAEKAAQAVLRIETSLARASRTMEQRRDPYANYNKMSIDQIAKLTPSVDWKRQFSIMEIPPVDSVVVGQPEFLAHADSALAAIPLEEWKDYLRWSVINTFAPYLSSEFDKQDFRFYGTLMSGTTEQRPRWKRVLEATEGSIGELMGQEWVRKYCSPTTKTRYEKLETEIVASYGERIRALPWMSAPTKEKALEKLAHVGRKVGYPDKWRDYSSLSTERGPYVRNLVAANRWWFRYQTGKLGKPVDPTEWDMTPQTYNAYYDGSKVEIVLPAAIFMVPGVADSLLDDAILYGYAGASTIGHELTHGFDDEGRQYDAFGNMRPWWTPADSAQFAKRTQLLVRQFDAYTVGDLHVRGLATLGENIADLGGIVIAYDAFKKTDQWKNGTVINGLTPDQRFFLGYSMSWLGHWRPEMLAQLIMTDVHSPDFLRVNGPLSNLPEFYKAFGVKPGDKLYLPEDQRVRIW
jgi:putative endopeptidase